MRTKLSQFQFDLPEELIAQYPCDIRDESRLMVVHKETGRIEHKVFKDMIEYFNDEDVIIRNNTKVFPARLYGRKEKTGASIEVFLLRELNVQARLWDVLVDPARKIAGLHFSKQLLKRLEIKGINFAEVTLHVGLGTFRNIEVEDLSKHKMDAEYFKIPEDAVQKINKGIKERRRVCSVGTTSMRSIESAISAESMLKQAEGWTNRFIYPPYEFTIANSMITNFHLLLSLVQKNE